MECGDYVSLSPLRRPVESNIFQGKSLEQSDLVSDNVGIFSNHDDLLVVLYLGVSDFFGYYPNPHETLRPQKSSLLINKTPQD